MTVFRQNAVVANTRKGKQSTNIEREIEMISLRENSTFSFCHHTKMPTLKNQKSYFSHPFFRLFSFNADRVHK
jgi:hypothetical protein